MNYKTTLFAIMLTATSFNVYSQDMNLEQTVAFINGKFSGKCKIFNDEKGREFVIDFYKGSEVYRQDKVWYGTLNPNTVSYAKDEGAIIIRCKTRFEDKKLAKKMKGGCIERNFIEKKIIGPYSRINFPYSGDKKSTEELINAFKNLINLVEPTAEKQ